jgi:hypothetical protein
MDLNKEFAFDNQSVISDITEINTTSSFEIIKKKDELHLKIEVELSKLTIEILKEKCKVLGIGNLSKLKKTELLQLILQEFNKLFETLKNKKNSELKDICKFYNIKGFTGVKKDELILMILNYCSLNLKFKIPEITDSEILENEETKTQNANDSIKISLLEELERQKKEIELKMKEEFDKQKKIEEEIQFKIDQENQIKIEEEKKRIEDEKKKEKEDAKKKKQSIPKNVRVIVWNHYIGEDIIKHRCLCCKKVVISNTNFEVGHVISEKNGGTLEINNLRPICFACNHSMGIENMIDFVVKYGLYIG